MCSTDVYKKFKSADYADYTDEHRRKKKVRRLEVEEDKTMAKATVEIPDERLVELDGYKGRLGELLLLGLAQIKVQEALYLYKRGLISFGRASEIAGLSQQELMCQAKANGIQPRWSEKMVKEELE